MILIGNNIYIFESINSGESINTTNYDKYNFKHISTTIEEVTVEIDKYFPYPVIIGVAGKGIQYRDKNSETYLCADIQEQYLSTPIYTLNWRTNHCFPVIVEVESLNMNIAKNHLMTNQNFNIISSQLSLTGEQKNIRLWESTLNYDTPSMTMGAILYRIKTNNIHYIKSWHIDQLKITPSDSSIETVNIGIFIRDNNGKILKRWTFEQDATIKDENDKIIIDNTFDLNFDCLEYNDIYLGIKCYDNLINISTGARDPNTKYLGNATEFTNGFKNRYSPSSTSDANDWGSPVNKYNQYGLKSILTVIEQYNDTTHPKKLHTLLEAYHQWSKGEKFPIVILGDSTTDGYRVTGGGGNTFGTDHVSSSGKLYTDQLQSLLRDKCNNSTLRIYNAGFSGKTLSWCYDNFESMVMTNPYYKDAQMAFISFGINDQINSLSAYNNWKETLCALIEKIYAHNIQPVLLTTQATAENYNRYANRCIAYCDQAKKEIAKEYDLELIDINYWTQLYNLYSNKSLTAILPDLCHYGDAGHLYEANVLFRSLCPLTIDINKENNIISFNNQKISSALKYSDYASDDEVLILSTPFNNFKLRAQCENNIDKNILTAWIFITDSPKTLIAYSGTVNNQYIKIDNGSNISLTSTEQTIMNLDMGLHKIEVYSGIGNIDFYGLKLN